MNQALLAINEAADESAKTGNHFKASTDFLREAFSVYDNNGVRIATGNWYDQMKKWAHDKRLYLKFDGLSVYTFSIRPYPKIVCSRCDKEQGSQPHECPFQSEVNNNKELCNCCDACKAECEFDLLHH